jgi:ribosomal-protein-alanine N-acetyltransferase
LFLQKDPEERMIEACNFTQIFRGAFQACYLGYQIGKEHEGNGLMCEALEAAIQYMFKQQNLHRIMANYMLTNQRSGALLKRLGFVIEGRAKKYLLIHEHWEEHILTSLTNDQWVLPNHLNSSSL